MFLNSAFQLRDTLESAVPTELQFCRNQTRGWVSGVVLSNRLVRSIAGSLKFPLERLEHIVAAPYFFALRRHRRFDRSRFEHAQKLFFDRIVHRKAAEGD